jgi:two-component system chemotaxis response regulator CheY
MSSVLIVEDRADVRLALRYMLEAHDYRVAEAADGAEALAYVATESVDVILTDLYMPQMDGLSLVRALRKSKSAQPRIIAMSGSPNLGKEAALDAARVLGADAVLRKPFSREQLVRAIASVTNPPEREDQA